MKVFVGLVTTLVLLAPSAVCSQELPKFQDVVVGATALTTLPGGYLLVSRPDGAYVCVLDIREGYFVTLMQGGKPDASIPSAICSAVDEFKQMDLR